MSTIVEGGELSFAVILGDNVTFPVEFDYSFSGSTTALINAQPGRVRIAAGQRVGAIVRSTRDDALVNGTRNVTVTVRFSANNNLAANPNLPQTAVGSIRDNDTAPQLPVVTVANAATVREGQVLSFPLALSASSQNPVRIAYRLSDETGTLAQDPVGTTVILAGASGGRIAVDTRDNRVTNPGSTMTVVLTEASGARIGAPRRATGTIADNGPPPPPPPPPVVTIGDAEAVREGGAMRFPLKTSAASRLPVIVGYNVNDGTGTLNPPASARAAIAAGSTDGEIVLSTRDNGAKNIGDGIEVSLTDARNARIGDPRTASGAVIDSWVEPPPEPPDVESESADPIESGAPEASETPVVNEGETASQSATASASSQTGAEPGGNGDGTGTTKAGIPAWPFVALAVLAGLIASAYFLLRLFLRAECTPRIAAEGAEITAPAALTVPEITVFANARPGAVEPVGPVDLIFKEIPA